MQTVVKFYCDNMQAICCSINLLLMLLYVLSFLRLAVDIFINISARCKRKFHLLSRAHLCIWLSFASTRQGSPS